MFCLVVAKKPRFGKEGQKITYLVRFTSSRAILRLWHRSNKLRVPCELGFVVFAGTVSLGFLLTSPFFGLHHPECDFLLARLHSSLVAGYGPFKLVRQAFGDALQVSQHFRLQERVVVQDDC